MRTWVLAVVLLTGIACIVSGCGIDQTIAPITHPLRAPRYLCGTVVDQDGKPVADAKVNLRETEMYILLPWLVFASPTAHRDHRFSVTTKSDGSFRAPFTAESIDVTEVTKEGYIGQPIGVSPQSIQNKWVLYDLAAGNRQNVRTRKTARYAIETDGRDYCVDLETGLVRERFMERPGAMPSIRPSDRADLICSITWAGDRSWLVTMVAPGGGVWPAKHMQPYAPEDGYTRGFSALFGGYGREDMSYFYAKTDGGRYCYIAIDLMYQSRDSVSLQLQYIINTSGSRFLVPAGQGPYSDTGQSRAASIKGYDFPFDNYRGVTADRGIAWWQFRSEAGYPILSPRDFSQLMADPNSWPFVARQIYAPDATLEEIARSDNDLRWAVACNPAVSPELEQRLYSGFGQYELRDLKEHKQSVRDFLISKGYYQEYLSDTLQRR